jgi:hypothetical protein
MVNDLPGDQDEVYAVDWSPSKTGSLVLDERTVLVISVLDIGGRSAQFFNRDVLGVQSSWWLLGSPRATFV